MVAVQANEDKLQRCIERLTTAVSHGRDHQAEVAHVVAEGRRLVRQRQDHGSVKEPEVSTSDLPTKAVQRRRAAASLRGSTVPEGSSRTLPESAAAFSDTKRVPRPVPKTQPVQASAASETPVDAHQAAPEPAAAAPREVASLIFDPDWYRRSYPDVASSGVDPVYHYWQHGAAEGRNPNPFFDTGWYVSNNNDCRTARLNPFLHYLLYGYREGHPPRAPESACAS